MTKKKEKMELYFIVSPNNNTVEFTEAHGPEDALGRFFDANEYDTNEEFLVFKGSDAATYRAVPSSFRKVK